MAYTTVPDKAIGDIFTEQMWDSYVRDNLNKGVIRQIGYAALGLNQQSVSFQNIPADYAHLLLVCCVRMNGGTVLNVLACRFNNDTGSNYDYESSVGNGASVSSSVATAQTFIDIQNATTVGSLTNSYTAGVTLIPNYANTSLFKATSSWSGAWHTNTLATGNNQTKMTGGHWLNTNAINRIDLYEAGAANLLALNSTFALYGLAGL
jgi:hypothetical protein